LNLGTQDVIFCNFKWARLNDYIYDSNGFAWKISAISNSNVFTVVKPANASNLFKSEICSVRTPNFLFGTMTTANNEYILQGKDNTTKLPLVWLVENITEKEYGRENSVERDVNWRIYLLDDNNPKQMLAENFRKEVVTPMISLKDELLRVVQNNRIFKRYDSVDTRPITRFGNENEKGIFQNILDDNLSGVELKMNLSIYKTKKCVC
jgi:hypothetical protein